MISCSLSTTLGVGSDNLRTPEPFLYSRPLSYRGKNITLSVFCVYVCLSLSLCRYWLLSSHEDLFVVVSAWWFSRGGADYSPTMARTLAVGGSVSPALCCCPSIASPGFAALKPKATNWCLGSRISIRAASSLDSPVFSFPASVGVNQCTPSRR